MGGSQHKWTRGDTILAFEFYYYCAPKDMNRADNPDIIALAKAIGTTAASLKMKLQNFKSLDAVYTENGRVGLTGASAQDREITAEFWGKWDKLAQTAEAIKQRIGFSDENSALSLLSESEEIPQGADSVSLQKIRIGQIFFRRALLAAYGGQCCITGIRMAGLLRASHIKPWTESSAAEKTNPRNSLLLNALFDAAFDRGYISLDEDCRLLVSSKIQTEMDKTAAEIFMPYQGKAINMPSRFPPDMEFIQYHRESVFLR